MKKYNKEIAEQINNYLVEDDWKFIFDEENGIFKFNLEIKNKIRAIQYIIDVKETEYLVYVRSPLSVSPGDKKIAAEMAEFVCRVNYGLKQCNFEFDMSDGELLVKCYVDCDGRLPSKKIVKNSLFCPAMVYTTYGEGIIGVIYRDEQAETAIEKCEKGQREESESDETPPRSASEPTDAERMLAQLAARFGTNDNKQARGGSNE